MKRENSARTFRTGILLISAGLLMLSPLSAAQATAGNNQSSQGNNTHQVMLTTGVDGNQYEAYKPSVIDKVQTALEADGLYKGPVNGELDDSTKQAIAEFQKQHDVYVSGVPSPETRERLFSNNS